MSDCNNYNQYYGEECFKGSEIYPKMKGFNLNNYKIKRARFYINTYNLFSIDNLKEFQVDPEVSNANGLQAAQNRVVNVGFNLSF